MQRRSQDITPACLFDNLGPGCVGNRRSIYVYDYVSVRHQVGDRRDIIQDTRSRRGCGRIGWLVALVQDDLLAPDSACPSSNTKGKTESLRQDGIICWLLEHVPAACIALGQQQIHLRRHNMYQT